VPFSFAEQITPHFLGSCRSTIELHPRLVALNILPERSPALRLRFGRSALEMVHWTISAGFAGPLLTH
jgi:hypothetical protein